jgi:fructan beta-fructosidase
LNAERRRRFLLAPTLALAIAVGFVWAGQRGRAQSAASPAPAAPAYQEPLRPRFHFSPKTDFTNDPNGLVYYKGEYHLFYQAREFADLGNPEWGHAVSTDLVHWRQLPIAIPKVGGVVGGYGQRICSGSAIVDWNNTSGFGNGKEPPLVAAYTDPCIDGANAWQAQSIAFSVDRGRTWTKYTGNPVLDIKARGFRDPKLIWHEATRRWLAPIAYPDRGMVAIYSSPNLREWTHLSDFEAGRAECPDLFPMTLAGTTTTKWVLMVASGDYWVGQFDGTTFVPDGGVAPRGRLDYGSNYYAAQTYSDVPGGRRLLVAWMRDGLSRTGVWARLPWQSNMTVVRELRLVTIDGAPQVLVEPAPELRQLRAARYHVAESAVATDTSDLLPAAASGSQLDIEATIDPGTATRAGLKVLVGPGHELVVGYDVASNELYVERVGLPAPPQGRGRGGVATPPVSVLRAPMPQSTRGNPVKLRVLVDRSAVEVFAGGGARAMSIRVIPIQSNLLASAARPDDRVLTLDGRGGVAVGARLVVNSGPNGPLGDVESLRVSSVDTPAAASDASTGVSVSPTLRRAWPAGTLVSNEPGYGVSVFAAGGRATLKLLDVWAMRSAW